MPSHSIYVNDERTKKLGSLAELYGLKISDVMSKLIDDTFTREFPAEKKQEETSHEQQ